MVARIYNPARNAMQSGKGRSKAWVLEFEQQVPRPTDPLMGWTSSPETLQQVRLEFDSAAQAIAYAERHGIPYDLAPASVPRPQRKSYSDNFRWGRKENWTH